MKRKKKLTADQRTELAEFERRSDENLRRLRALVDRGWAELRERQSPRRERS